MAYFSQFSRFQPGRPEPLQKAWFYQDSFNFKRFWSQWLILASFWGFSLAAQNPSRRHDFTRIHPIIFDFVPMADFGKFLGFQPGRPETFQKVWFYQDSCNFNWFWSQWRILTNFWGFSLAAQNPPKRHDFTRIYPILSDFEANGLF